jgi:ribosomal protein S18 acetylase RimI-like enzyme
MHADLRTAIDAVAAALSLDGEQWTLREEADADQPVVDALYRSTRWTELEQVPWPDEAKRQFLDSQSRLQADHYRRNYPGAVLGLLERVGVPVGRFYLHASPGEFRLMDIVLLPEHRGIGLGERMLRALMQVAQAQGRSITLHVEPNNPAQRLYARLGFALIEDRGVYHFLGWSPPS